MIDIVPIGKVSGNSRAAAETHKSQDNKREELQSAHLFVGTSLSLLTSVWTRDLDWVSLFLPWI